jgi:hypothetical protein
VAPAVFKTVAGRVASWVGSIPIHSRHRGPLRLHPSRFAIARSRQAVTPNALAPLAGRGLACATIVLLAAFSRDAQAQRADSARAGAAPTPSQTLRPPLSPRRAFLTSLAAPGYAQSVLGRPNAAALFILTEAIGLLMVRETSTALRQARRLQADSVPVYFVNPGTGVADTIYRPGRYSSELVRAREAHREDWIAALVANHVIAAADAFVAAHLWDVPVQVGFRPADRSASLSARFRW